MNRVPHRLGTSSAASFYGRFCHVHSFQSRLALRCIHAKTNSEMGESRSDGEALKAASGGIPNDSLNRGYRPAQKGIQSEGISDLRIRRYETVKKVAQGTEDYRPARAQVLKQHVKSKESSPPAPSKPPQQSSRRIVDNRPLEQRSRESPEQISCTIVYDIPEQATKENFLGYLNKVTKPISAKQYANWVHSIGDLALVVLFTPGLAAFVENDPSFVPSILKSVTRSSTWDQQHPPEVDVVCACVDGLAPVPNMLSKSRGERSQEGFTILFGSRDTTLSPLWTDNEAHPSRSPSMQATITLREGHHGPPDLTLPLANTLFKNGRLSTLLVSNWHWSKSAKETWTLNKGPSERTNVSINVFGGASKRQQSFFFPSVRLTPARPIVSGLGNIVRTIDFGGEVGTGPASHELEPTITKYLEAIGHANTTIDVWALIIPPVEVPMAAKSGVPVDSYKETEFSLTCSPEKLQKSWLSSPNGDEDISSYIAWWLKRRNGKLCRVLSGGGGWGAKQGLLSLDPQITYDEVPEARFDFSGGSLEDQQTSALGNIAQAGAFIQFLVARREILPQPFTLKGEYLNLMRRSAVFGAVPSTVDDVYVPPPEINGDSTGFKHAWRNDESIHTHRGHFGFVSERGMFLRNGRNYNAADDPCHSTKIDLPYSYLYMDCRKSAVFRKIRTEGKAMPTIEEAGRQSNELRGYNL